MSAVLFQLSQPATTEGADVYQASKGVTGLLSGEPNSSAPVQLTGLTDTTAYALTIQNQGAGGKHLNVPGILIANATGVTVGTLTATNLTVTGTSTLNIVNASGLVTLSKAGTALAVTNNVTIGGTLGLTGAGTSLFVDHDAIVSGTLTVGGNVALGNANDDVHTVIGATTFRNAAATATQLFVDAGNNRVVVGSATAFGPDTTPNLQVVGRLYVAPETANDLALEIRRSSAATVGWDVGVTSTNDLVFKDTTGAETFRAGAAASANQAVVTGQLRATNGLVVVASGILVAAGGLTVTGTTTFHSGFTLDGPSNIDGNGGTAGQIRIGGVIVNAASFDSTESLLVNGASRLKGAVTVTTGGAAVTGGTTTDTLVVTSVMRTDSNANKILHTGGGAKGTSDTTGYVWLPYSLGKPTGNPGSPTGSSGSVPLALDLTNNKICMWTGAAWISTAALT